MRPILYVAVTAALSLSLAGCGSSSDDAASPGAPSSTSSDAVPGPGSVATAAATTTAAPSGAATPSDICTSVTAAAMGTALKETVTEKSEVVGCAYEPSDTTQATISLEQKSLGSYAGGFDAATGSLSVIIKDGTGSTVDAGDKAYIEVGQDLGSGVPTGVGLVQLGDAIVQVNLHQEAGLTDAQVTALLTAAVKVVGTA